ncbi:MAG TPA: mobile mystery protein B [Candidatus Sulfotelmatobacter sp.]|nr:mobile mystery protein B [Candidatus Sulfotelmatobacter sp.]
MSDVFDQPDDAATPLTDAEKRDLIPKHIAFRRELNAAEQENIVRGQEWALRRRRRDLLTEKFVRDLHAHMFGDVWRWAGDFRRSERNIGIDHWEIPAALRMLLDDAKTWVENGVYPPDELAVRLHHRLVQIHAFPNGNGRHARLIADLLVMQLGGERFSWGRRSLRDAGTTRTAYVDALQTADRHDMGPLLAFARS